MDPSPSSSTAYAIATPGPDGTRWMYLAALSSGANLMRTSSPFHARTWPSVEELQLWLDDLPQTSKLQLAERAFHIVPLGIISAPSLETITLHRVATPSDYDPTIPQAC